MFVNFVDNIEVIVIVVMFYVEVVVVLFIGGLLFEEYVFLFWGSCEVVECYWNYYCFIYLEEVKVEFFIIVINESNYL